MKRVLCFITWMFLAGCGVSTEPDERADDEPGAARPRATAVTTRDASVPDRLDAGTVTLDASVPVFDAGVVTCAPGCSSRTGYHLYCPTNGSTVASWCPESNTCSVMDSCQASQKANCDATCAGGCQTVYDGPQSCCDCGGGTGSDGGVSIDAGTVDAGTGFDGGVFVDAGTGTDGGTGSDGGVVVDAGTGTDGGTGSDGGPICDTVDICGVCNGDGSTCPGCDGVMGSNQQLDVCGVCGGDSSSCEGCDGIPWSGTAYDACGVCGGDATGSSSCPPCDGIPGHVYDLCGVCNGDGSTCPGCDSVMGSGRVYDACGVCGGDDSECIGCDGVIGSGLEEDACGVCGGNGPPCNPPPPPAKEYVMSIYFVPADGADGAAPLLSNAAYASPKALLAALLQSETFGSAHVNQKLVGLSHSIGHAYVDFFSRNKDGTGVTAVAGYPTGQTGGGGAQDVINVGAGGTILGTYPGRMNTVAEASNDIALRKKNHGIGVVVRGPNGVPIAVENSAQLIGRADFILSEATWKAVQARVTLHSTSGTDKRYALMMEPAIKSRQPGETTGGEGAGCTSFASMCVVFSGAIPRTTVNPVWTRTITFGERTIGQGTYKWGSHIRGNWSPAANIRDKNGGLPAVTSMSAWTYPNGLDWDGILHKVTLAGLEGATTQRTITGYWYDPDYMYFWVKGVYDAALVGGGTNASLGLTWKSKGTLGSNALGGYPYIEVDVSGAKPKATWDTAIDPYTKDWIDE
ncbi:hypothetical protein KH5H1_75360 [Corallococcus caeni]|uniref:hypothetical protein n=1 Tax=Corallococcus caeni TaxID=3082388 RepID=UPI002956B08E|nr:hypothetical protein KH5H1_75360 [Corallococcus sp. KH5-1]